MAEKKKVKILFIDDDNFLRKVYEAELSENNYDVVLAIDGDDGLTKARSENPDLIILDMIMPKKNGFEVLTELQSDPQLASIPVIILSNLGQDNDVKKGLDMGAVDYLVKDNTTLSLIINKIEQFVHSKSQSKTSREKTLATVDTKLKKPAEPKPIVTKTPIASEIIKKQVKPVESTETTPLPVKEIFCPQCGTQLKGTYKFCTSCGYKLNS